MSNFQIAQIPEPHLQTLPGKWAIFCLQKENFLQQLGVFPQNRTLFIAYSVGIDSTALLFWAKCMEKRWNCQIIAVHFNHQIRQQSETEAVFAQKICSQLKIPLQIQKLRVPAYCQENNQGLEEGGRILRYTALAELQSQYPDSLLFTGHHLNDLAEDFFLRLNRGTGWPALGGMTAYDKDRFLVRPFLLTSKQELTDFVHAIKIPWQEDLSNSDTNFLRNRIRHNVIKPLCDANPAFLQQIKNIWLQAEIDRKYWKEIENKMEIPPKSTEFLLSKKQLNVHQAVRLRLYKKILNKLGKGQVLADNLFKLDRIFTQKQTGKTVQFPGGKTATLCKKGIIFKLNLPKNKPLFSF